MTTRYILRNKLTGKFFNGTNFLADEVTQAKFFDQQLNASLVEFVWGKNAQVIAITEEQMQIITKSADLISAADHSRRLAAQINTAKYAAPYWSAATRLSQRASRLLAEVYSDFSRCEANA